MKRSNLAPAFAYVSQSAFSRYINYSKVKIKIVNQSSINGNIADDISLMDINLQENISCFGEKNLIIRLSE